MLKFAYIRKPNMPILGTFIPLQLIYWPPEYIPSIIHVSNEY